MGLGTEQPLFLPAEPKWLDALGDRWVSGCRMDSQWGPGAGIFQGAPEWMTGRCWSPGQAGICHTPAGAGDVRHLRIALLSAGSWVGWWPEPGNWQEEVLMLAGGLQ